MSDIIKTWSSVNNPVTKLNRIDAFNLELSALCAIRRNYECKCDEPKDHFPKITKTDRKGIKLHLNNKGESLDKEGVKDNMKKVLIPSLVKEQVSCIVENLVKCGVRHVDCPENGQNLCWDGETLSLIDFDSCIIDGKKCNNKCIKYWSNSYGKGKEYIQKYGQQIMYTIYGSDLKEWKEIETKYHTNVNAGKLPF